MTTQLQERHRSLFASLTLPEVELVWDRVAKRWIDEARSAKVPPDSPGSLFEVCRDIGLDHARVVLSLANENGAARPVIEKLIGHPIKNWAASVEAELEAKAEARAISCVGKGGPDGKLARADRGEAGPTVQPRKVDTRLVVSVAPNPHRAGSDMASSYEKWRVGDTAQMCRDRGLIARSLRRDVRKGYVVLEGVG